VWGSLDSSLWHTISAYDAAHSLIELRYFDLYLSSNEAHALAQLNELVCGYWLGAAVALLVRKPRLLSLDEAGRLHSATGQSVEYADGWGFFAWHGVQVPERVILAPRTLSRADFLTENIVEVRGVIQERMGAERFVWELEARFIDGSAQGVLHEVDLPGDPDRVARYVPAMFKYRMPPVRATTSYACPYHQERGRSRRVDLPMHHR